jgi:integrase
MRGKNGGVAVSVREGEERSSKYGGQAVPGGTEAGLPASLVLYCARHAFGTVIYEGTGILAMVMKVMGHTDVRTAMRYQHPILDPVREAIDQRNLRHNSRHCEVRVQ